MKGPFRRLNETAESASTDLREMSDHLSRVATVGLIAFALVAIVSVTALMIAVSAKDA